MTEPGVTAFRGVLEGLKRETLLYYESLDGPGRFGMIVPMPGLCRNGQKVSM